MSTKPKTALRAHLVLASKFENIEVAERALLDLCAEAGCRGDDEYWLITALREGLANAIRHGNQGNPDLMVDVSFTVSGQTVEIRIKDQGEGFDLSEVPDPTDAANILRPSGRGIFYMHQFMNEVEFSWGANGGTTVHMIRQLTPSNENQNEV